MKDFNSVEYYGKDCDEKKYDAKETASFIENLERYFQDYQEKAKNLEICYERYYCNNSYVGTTAESSKEFISKRQNDEIHYENLNIQKEFLLGVSNIEDIFKEMVDSSPNAKIDSGVLGVIKREQQAYGDVFDKEGYELECWTRKMVDKFGRFGVTTFPDCSTIRIRYEELSGPGGHLDKCNKKLENFDDYSLEYLKQLVKGKALQEAINGQHFSCKDNEKRDFVHECAIIAVMSDTYNVKKWGLGIEDINAAIGYKGDVYSGSMDIDDKMSDVEAYNLYYRMKNCEDGNIWDVMTEYNIGVENGSINGSKEFLERFGKGDTDKGLKKLKEELSEENLLTNILSKGVEDEDIENTKDDFLDYISKESGVY